MATEPRQASAAAFADRMKPSFLRRVQIRAYKSIAFCDVVLEPLTIFVGRNATGKSNFLDALAFLRDLMEMRVTEAVNERKGWRSIHCRSARTPYIEMALQATFESFSSIWDANYSFVLEIAKQNQVRVHREHLNLDEHGGKRQCGFVVENGELQWIGAEYFLDDSEWTPEIEPGRLLPEHKLEDPRFFRGRDDRLLLSAIGTQPFIDLAESLRASCIYNFSPPAIRTHQPITASPILVRDGRPSGCASPTRSAITRRFPASSFTSLPATSASSMAEGWISACTPKVSRSST
jgi:hypothetical protein